MLGLGTVVFLRNTVKGCAYLSLEACSRSRVFQARRREAGQLLVFLGATVHGVSGPRLLGPLIVTLGVCFPFPCGQV